MNAEPKSTAPAGGGRHWLRDWFLLEDAKRHIQALGPDRQALVRKHYDAGLRRALVADDLNDDNGLVSALALYREAVGFLAAAAVASTDAAGDVAAALASPWEAFTALGKSGRFVLPADLDEARRILTPAGPLAYDETPAETLRAQHATVKAVLRSLRDRLEPRTSSELRVSRALRIGVAAAVGGIALVWLASGLFSPANIALHKTVTLNKSHPASTAPADGSGLVNGEIEASYGAQTTRGAAWAMIDLGRVYAIRDVVVHNRKDGWFDESLPLTLELSRDGTTFTEVGRRSESFSASSPWIAEVHGAPARFVRLRSQNYIALTEIEVHEAK